MTAEFLKWFLDQEPFRQFRLAMKDGTEELIISPDHVGFNDTNTIRVVSNKGLPGMGVETIDLRNVQEIRLWVNATKDSKDGLD